MNRKLFYWLICLVFAAALTPPAFEWLNSKTLEKNPPIILNSLIALPDQKSKSRISDEYIIYSIVIDATVRPIRQGYDEIVIEKLTTTSDGLTEFSQMSNQTRKQLSKTTQETLNNFLSINKKPHRLTDSFYLKIKPRLISIEELRKYFAESPGGWAKFYANHPKAARGILNFSRVGFNKQHNEAIVYRAYQQDYLCGRGDYVVLKKKNDSWIIQKFVDVYIS